MAYSDISLLGATYPTVPSILLPKSGGGNVQFYDVSQETTAAEADVASGKKFFKADGSVGTGTASGGGGSSNIETGVYIPSEDIAVAQISFANTHTKLPIMAMMTDIDGYSDTLQSNLYWAYYNGEQLGGTVYTSPTAYRNGDIRYCYRGTSATGVGSNGVALSFPESGTGSTTGYPRYWVTESMMKPSSNTNSRYWRKDRHYKWVAVWLP